MFYASIHLIVYTLSKYQTEAEMVHNTHQQPRCILYNTRIRLTSERNYALDQTSQHVRLSSGHCRCCLSGNIDSKWHCQPSCISHNRTNESEKNSLVADSQHRHAHLCHLFQLRTLYLHECYFWLRTVASLHRVVFPFLSMACIFNSNRIRLLQKGDVL